MQKLSIETNPIHSERFLHSHQCKHYIISHTQLQNQHNFFLLLLLLFGGVIDLSYTTFELVPRYCCLFRETNDCLLDKKCHHFILISAMWQQGGHWTGGTAEAFSCSARQCTSLYCTCCVLFCTALFSAT